MVRPRGRRTSKNPSTKTSRRQKPVNRVSFAGVHPLVKENWDRTLTVQQNYAKLGLMTSLQGKSGGEQRKIHKAEQTDFIDEIDDLNSTDLNTYDGVEWRKIEDEDPIQSKLGNLKPGENLVVNGTIYEYHPIDGIIAVDEQVVKIGSKMSLHKKASKDDPLSLTTIADDKDLGAKAVFGRIVDDEGKSIVDKFKEEASNVVKIKRAVSEQEALVFISLINKYGDDYPAMARDIKLNKYQLSVGQLKRKFQRILKPNTLQN